MGKCASLNCHFLSLHVFCEFIIGVNVLLLLVKVDCLEPLSLF